ncbi:MAG TPA: uL15 family ribosomal protein [Candidatus Paceibacterota bacterium]
MQVHTLKLKVKIVRKKRIGRGGKRGSYSGRGVKGQKARSGHRIRPAERDLLIRLPKLRGYRNKSIITKIGVVNVGELEKKVKGAVVNSTTLGDVKILGGGEVKKAFTIEGLSVSKGAQAKIEAAGGKVLPALEKKKNE